MKRHIDFAGRKCIPRIMNADDQILLRTFMMNLFSIISLYRNQLPVSVKSCLPALVKMSFVYKLGLHLI